MVAEHARKIIRRGVLVGKVSFSFLFSCDDEEDSRKMR